MRDSAESSLLVSWKFPCGSDVYVTGRGNCGIGNRFGLYRDGRPLQGRESVPSRPRRHGRWLPCYEGGQAELGERVGELTGQIHDRASEAGGGLFVKFGEDGSLRMYQLEPEESDLIEDVLTVEGLWN